jgi:colanic acid/amylovoran biosynthesis glycosyltransferase
MSVRLAYLVSRVPAVNHTYLLREIRRLRELGVQVSVASLAPPDRPGEQLDAAEKEEAAAAFYVKPAGLFCYLRAHVLTFFQQPPRYLSTLLYALRCSGFAPKELPRWVFFFLQAMVVGHWMKRLQLTHLHCHYASSVALLVGRSFPITVSHTMHGPAEFDNPAAFQLTEKIRGSRFVVAISRYGRSQLMRYASLEDWRKLEVCPLGVDPERFHNPGNRNGGRPFHLLCVGQLVPQKGYPVLIDAIARLVASSCPVHLRIVGEGPLRPALEELIRRLALHDSVSLLGKMNPDQVVQLYHHVDAFAMASLAEGIPVVLMEAMAAGLPCVATRIMGIPELIEDGHSGLLVHAGDAAALADALVQLIENPELRRRLGETAQLRVRQEYNLRTNTQKLAALFARHLDAAPLPGDEAGRTAP